jgi:ABC-type dipeptide/oligopeptide/nickel transport system permease component
VIWKLGICIVVGYVIIGICMIFDPQRPKLFGAQSLKSASWLPVYLIGMGIISWLGQYSGQSSTTPLSPTNTNTIGLWYDLLIIAAFSLVIYFWAVAVRLPREDMLELVNEQSAEKDVPPATL